MTERVTPESTTPSGSATSFSVTVVVPTRNSARTIEPCPQSLRAQSTPCTVVVVDNGSTDGTQDLAEPLADIQLACGPERSAQRNQGARAAPASIMGFIDSDMVVTEPVVGEAAAAITEGAGAVIVPERTIGVGYWARVRAFERSFYNGSDTPGATRFYQWDVFEQAGRFDEHLTGPEDWDLTIEARQLAPVVPISAMIDHDEDRVRYFDKRRTWSESIPYFTRSGYRVPRIAIGKSGYQFFLYRSQLANRQMIPVVHSAAVILVTGHACV